MVMLSPSFTSAMVPPAAASGRHMADHHAPGAAGEAAVGDQARPLAQAGADQRAGRRQHLGMPGPPLGPR